MINWLKRHFIPDEGNRYRPHFLNAVNTRQVAAIVLVFELVLFILPTFNFVGVVNQLNLGAVLPSILSTLSNEEREKNNLPDLVVNPQLNQIAQMKAEDMAKKGYFAHTSPEGKTPWYWFENVGYKYMYAGENLAINFADSKDVTEAWMNSPTHRANIVAGAYTEVGTGVATGMYQGHETVFVAQVYGTPSAKVSAEIPQKNVLSTSTKVARSTPAVAVRDVFTEELPPSAVSTEVLGESQPPMLQETPTEKVLKSPSLIQKVFSSPRQTTEVVLYVILSIILIALFLNVAIKFDEQHPDLITNGLVVACLIFVVHISNSYISRNQVVTSFLAFNSTQVDTK